MIGIIGAMEAEVAILKGMNLKVFIRFKMAMAGLAG